MSDKHILWVKIGGLWPLHTGGRLRSFHIVSELSQRHRVTLLTTHGSGDDPRTLAEQLPQCERVVSFPHRSPKLGSARFTRALMRSWLSPLPVDLWKWRVPALRAEVDRLVGACAVDLCVADFLFAVPNVPLTSVVTTSERIFVIRVRQGTAEWVDVKRGAVQGSLPSEAPGRNSVELPRRPSRPIWATEAGWMVNLVDSGLDGDSTSW